MSSVVPADRKQLRACLLCSLVKNTGQFRRDGCDNCEDILGMKGSSDRVNECTSSTFDGLVALNRPDESWVARYQRVDGFTRGLYAVKVSGRLPEHVEDDITSRGVLYRPRDGTQDD